MLSIKEVGGSSVEVNYYANLGVAENHDYYSEEGSRPGVWWGSGASELGLSGTVSPDVFKNLLEGLSPDGTKQLVQKRNGNQLKRCAGFDLTFSMPKSFSVAWSQASRETRKELDERARRAAYQALQTVQDLCGITRRGKDGVIKESAKLIAAIFSHDTARGIPGQAPDANRHFHAVIPNVVVREDGTTGALFSRPLFKRRCKMALGALFRCELSKELHEMGLETHRPIKERKKERASWIELKCVPKDLVRAMSKRRAQIEKWLRAHGLTGAKASERAALRTREGKASFSKKELFDAWRKLGSEFGFTKSELEDVLANKPFAKRFSVEVEGPAAVKRAVRKLMETKARFTEFELLELTAVESQCRGLGIKEVRDSLAKTLKNSKELVRLKDEKGVRTFTTKEMLEVEKRMFDTSRRLNFTHSHSIDSELVSQTLAMHPTLRDEQTAALKAIAEGSDVTCIQGVAGSGKTFMLGVAKEIFERAGYEVLGTSLAAKASKGLEDGSGIKSTHVHQLLKDVSRGEISISDRSILVVDESGMVGSRHMEKLLSLVEQGGGKCVLVGDWEQIQAVDSGAAFRGIAERIGFKTLNEIIRQREDWAKDVVYDLRAGDAEKALTELASRDRLFIGQDREDAIERLVLDWEELAIERRELRDTLCFAGTTLEVRELNRQLQDARMRAGELGVDFIDLDGFEVHVGDRVMATRNKPELLLRNGSFADVVSIEEQILTLRLEDGFVVEVDTNEFDFLTLGYSVTTHKGQGTTVENAFILTGDGMTDRELSYVQGSRAKGFTKFYSDELTGGHTIQELAAKMNRSRQKELAHEYLLQGD